MNSAIPRQWLSPQRSVAKIRIESADGCDGSICHQPIFNEDGGLNRIEPHFHLVECESDNKRFYAIAIQEISRCQPAR
jgi:hypothetical protein